MAGKKQKRKMKPRIRPMFDRCPFCEEKKEPDYKNYKELSKFVTDRAKILASANTGICSKHQRKLGVEIKRARHLGLLPFSPEVK